MENVLNSPGRCPTVSPHSTLSNSSRSSNGLSNGHLNGHSNGLTNSRYNGLSNGHSNGLSNGFNGSARLTKSLSTTNLASQNSGAAGLRPKGLMEKFIASRGKMTPSAFTSSSSTNDHPSRVIITRPMRVQPKKPVLLRQHSSDSTDGSLMSSEQRSEVRSMTSSPQPPQGYKKFIGAEEKIQEELREMQQREEELK
ncbi:merozoite surface antigen 2-like [Hyalella azteca]|uniref:Merozoite surface antigen 2-like n=1 Tax=Hyalella azteca TaxID=294128 RepID=A0A8B7NWI3_HYAAZ|nr:merozoite surface antigen 2-like [Hyalella azteca]